MEILFALLFLGAIGYGIWYGLFRKRKDFYHPFFSKSSLSTAPTREPLNSEIMKKLEIIEKRIDAIEVQTNKVEKSVREISGWFWPILIGGLIGWFWNDIINMFNSLFLAG